MRKFLCFWVFLFSLAAIICISPAAMGAEVEVGQVVVTATRTEVEISDSPQSISVITKEEIMNTPDRTIPEVIQRAAGVQINQNGPMGSLPLAQIRGSEAGQVLIMIDGRRINDAQNGQFDLSNLPLSKDEIERIEVLRGGASALYGSDAMGGVINIITKSPTKEPYTRVSSSFGRFGTQEYSLSHRWKPGPLVTACLPPGENLMGSARTAITMLDSRGRAVLRSSLEGGAQSLCPEHSEGDWRSRVDHLHRSG